MLYLIVSLIPTLRLDLAVRLHGTNVRRPLSTEPPALCEFWDRGYPKTFT